jgi:hypothetical protein
MPLDTSRRCSQSAAFPLLIALALITCQVLAARQRINSRDGEPTFESMISACGKSRGGGANAWCARRSRARACPEPRA